MTMTDFIKTEPLLIGFKKLSPNAELPTYATPEAAGADVRAAEAYVLAPGERRLIATGLGCDIPAGWEIQVRPRSGLAFKYGVTVLNAPGTIDSDYQGELGVLLINMGHLPFEIQPGDRIAQIVVAPVAQGSFGWTGGFSRQTDRGAGGLGSTGVA
jgi:dUTP pyrophosphatase